MNNWGLDLKEDLIMLYYDSGLKCSFIRLLDLLKLGLEIDAWANFVIFPSLFFKFIILIQILF